EIAMLKTTGYRQRDLYALFGLETALLGITGGIVGTLIGLGVSYLVRGVVERAFFIHLPIVLDTLTLVSGVVIGLVTALSFGLLVLAISKLPVYEKPRPRILLWMLMAIGITVLCALIFVGLFLLGQVVNQLAVRLGNSLIGTYALVVFAGMGIILVGGSLVYLLATIVNSLVVFAPRSWKTSVMLAYRNLGRQRLRTTTTLTALFVGVFAIGLILILGQGIKDAVNSTL